MSNYDEFVLARVIADSLDGEYDDGNEVFYSVRIEDGFRMVVRVSDQEATPDRRFVVTVEDMDDES